LKQELSKREKILIFCAAVLALFYLAFQFGFLPMYTRYTEALAERERLAEEKAIIEENIANKPSIVDDNNNAREQFDFIKQDYPLLAADEEIDVVLTDLCVSNGLIPTMLRIDRPPDPVQGAKKDEQDTEQQLFTVITVVMNVTGNIPSLLGLLDDIDGLPYIRISKMNYSENRRDDTNLGGFQLTFELTYINP